MKRGNLFLILVVIGTSLFTLFTLFYAFYAFGYPVVVPFLVETKNMGIPVFDFCCPFTLFTLFTFLVEAESCLFSEHGTSCLRLLRFCTLPHR